VWQDGWGGVGWGDEPLSGVCECGEVVWKTALDLTLPMTLRRYDSEFFTNVPTWRFPLEVLLLLLVMLVKGSPTDNDGSVDE
jgi:hypothetical protein